MLSVLILVSSMAQYRSARLYSPDANRSGDIAGSCGGVARSKTGLSYRVARRTKRTMQLLARNVEMDESWRNGEKAAMTCKI